MRIHYAALAFSVLLGGCGSKHELASCKGGLLALNQDHWQPTPAELAALEKLTIRDGKETIPEVATAPDQTGTVLRIAHSERQWILRNGDDAGCVFNGGPDPEGAGVPPVASALPSP